MISGFKGTKETKILPFEIEILHFNDFFEQYVVFVQKYLKRLSNIMHFYILKAYRPKDKNENSIIAFNA